MYSEPNFILFFFTIKKNAILIYDNYTMNFLITGASSGLGRELFNSLSKNSSYNFFLLSKNIDELKKIKKINNQARIYHLDLNEIEKTKTIANQILEDSQNKIDVIICNAAEGAFGSIDDIPTDKFLSNFNVNFFSHLILIKSIYPTMKLRNFGHIINIASGTGIFGFQDTSSYSISKSCMQILIESMHMENVNNNIYAKNIFPGLINTNFENKNKYYNKKGKIFSYKKKETNLIANKIVKNIFSKKLNIFCQLNPMVAFMIKLFPILEKLRKIIF